LSTIRESEALTVTNQESDISRFLSEWTVAERDGDATALARLLADDFVGVGPLGFMLPKQAWIERHGSGGLKYDSFDLDETQIRQYGDAALVTARLNQPGTYQGNPIPAAARATLMLVSQPSGRQLAGISLTFIAGTPGAPPVPGR
jgi:ketosteroid isomerase-like protein